jgi:hypothetical protein
MIKRHIRPGGGGAMTDIALFVGDNVGCVFTGGSGAVVATRTDTLGSNATVIEMSVGPVIGG